MYNVKRQYYTSDKNSFKCMVTMNIFFTSKLCHKDVAPSLSHRIPVHLQTKVVCGAYQVKTTGSIMKKRITIN